MHIRTHIVHLAFCSALPRFSRRSGKDMSPTDLFEDTEHNCKVAVGMTNHKLLVAVFRRVDNGIKATTVYHTRKLDKLISAKLQRGAWRRIQ